MSRIFGRRTAFNVRPDCENTFRAYVFGRQEAFNARPDCGNKSRAYVFGRQEAFNARPEGATSSQPRASERSERHPGLGRRVSDTPPEGAKATTEELLPRLLPPPGAPRWCCWPNPGCRSLRSLALGCELVAPSGRADDTGNETVPTSAVIVCKPARCFFKFGEMRTTPPPNKSPLPVTTVPESGVCV